MDTKKNRGWLARLVCTLAPGLVDEQAAEALRQELVMTKLALLDAENALDEAAFGIIANVDLVERVVRMWLKNHHYRVVDKDFKVVSRFEKTGG